MKNNKIKWEIWSKEGELTCGPADNFTEKNKWIIKGSKLIYTYYTSSTDEGMQIYHEKMGFEPYKSARQ